MKALVNFILIIIIGIIFLFFRKSADDLTTAKSLNKNTYNLEGKYSLNKINDFEKSDTSIEIIKEGEIYKITGKKLEFEKYSSEKNWKEFTNYNWNFIGKIIKESSLKNDNEYFPHSETVYIYKLQNDTGNILTILVYGEAKVKEAVTDTSDDINDFRNAIYNGKEINDIIVLLPEEEYVFKGIKEN